MSFNTTDSITNSSRMPEPLMSDWQSHEYNAKTRGDENDRSMGRDDAQALYELSEKETIEYGQCGKASSRRHA